MGEWLDAYWDLKSDHAELEGKYERALSLIKNLETMESPEMIKSEIQAFKLGLEDLHKYLAMRA